jgi:hypothetical protein
LLTPSFSPLRIADVDADAVSISILPSAVSDFSRRVKDDFAAALLCRAASPR